MKIYPSDPRTFYVLLILVGLWLILILWPPVTLRATLGGSILLFWILLIGLLLTKFTYAVLNTETKSFERRELLIFHNKTEILNISAISYAPTWRLQTALRSVFIFYEGKWAKRMELKNSMFKEITLGEIIYDLKQANPAIYLDEAAQELMQKYERGER